MASRARFEQQDDDFELSSSEDERKLEKYKNRPHEESDSEVEVFNVGTDDSESDNESDIALSDVEGQEQDDDLPNVQAWGKEKKNYYGADYVDPDYGGFQGKDALAAETEETEATNLHEQLLQQFGEDFDQDLIFKKPDKDELKEGRDLTAEQDENNSREFFGLVNDFKVKISLAKDYLHPIIEKVRDGTIEQCKAVEFVQRYYQLILNYATNIYMYLLLKGNNKLKNHPIIQRLYQYRQLLSQMEPVFQEIIKPQVELLLIQKSDEKGTEDTKKVSSSKKKKTLKLLVQLQNAQTSRKSKAKSGDDRPSKKLRLDTEKSLDKQSKQVRFKSESSEEESDMEVDEGKQVEEGDNQLDEKTDEPEESSKRAITYKMAKNKGLTPRRKKELRNPRVKHKLKYRKALIRRKGAVRAPRTELSRYSGEIFGIKASVSKSIKLKA